MTASRVHSLWVRKLTASNFADIERQGGLHGGGGAKYIEAPRVRDELMAMLGVSHADLVGQGYPITTRVIGAPHIAAPLVWGHKVDAAGRTQRLRLFQNRYSVPNPRHPAWRPDNGFPSVEPEDATTDAVRALTAEGIRVYVVRTREGGFYAGYLLGGYPGDWPDAPSLRHAFAQNDFAGPLDEAIDLVPDDALRPFRLAGEVPAPGDDPEPGAAAEEDDGEGREPDPGDAEPPAVAGARGGYARPETARQVDDVAMELALAWAEARFEGATIRRMVHNNPGYDIAVVRGGYVHHYVEVKGTLLPEPAFFLSENERRHAEDNADCYTLVVFHSIDLDARTGVPCVHEGALEPRDELLRPFQWRGLLPG